MPWGLAVAAVGAYASYEGAKKQANAAGKGADLTVAEQRRQFDLTRGDMMPWLTQGGWALDKQRQFLEGDWSGFQNSPDYKFAVDQGFKGLERNLASNLGTSSGGADADRIALGQGLATQYAGNYWNKLAGLSNTGQQTAQQLGQFGANAATNIGNAYANAANARGSSYASQANTIGQFANQFNQYASYKGWY